MLMKFMTKDKGYVNGRQMWILKQIWKKKREINKLLGLRLISFFNKATNCQINEVWSVVITQ